MAATTAARRLQRHFYSYLFCLNKIQISSSKGWFSCSSSQFNVEIWCPLRSCQAYGHPYLACMFPRSTYETFSQKMYQTYNNHKCFSKPKLARIDFTLSLSLCWLLIRLNFSWTKTKTMLLLSTKQLLVLQNVSLCLVFFHLYRIQPKQLSLISIAARVKGVMEAIGISCVGYPTRRTFTEFIDRFGIVVPQVLDASYEISAATRLLEKVDLKGYQWLLFLQWWKGWAGTCEKWILKL